MTRTAESTAAAVKTVNSLQDLDLLPEGSIVTLGSLSAEAGPHGWLLPGNRKPVPTWDIVRRSGTTHASVLREGKG
ncbi:hypothetical protein [Arthrobacter caoxuetaonis]|uniref:Uncharacterized protein n=1 Tax=Arthrobacter caoxuetaonis TaxID=2886935 RepID=A0A9X1SEF3_9MICC|nr:hypothetical protein [Arthrobacter caoxuetaonis]MCC3299802.1 hypothetical protein [Arthrobacter caoxuetaonis]USQ59298.1 hypothetical protein NF551_17080 [Arthrobacter caoxuetaonis]